MKRRTLANLYNEHPTWLQLAHRQLDDAVLGAYGWQRYLPDDAILERLLALNYERAATHGNMPTALSRTPVPGAAVSDS